MGFKRGWLAGFADRLAGRSLISATGLSCLVSCFVLFYLFLGDSCQLIMYDSTIVNPSSSFPFFFFALSRFFLLVGFCFLSVLSWWWVGRGGGVKCGKWG